MAISRSWLTSVALVAALGACTAMDAPPANPPAAEAGPAAGMATLDAAIAAAGGEAALSKVQELFWTGDAKVTADGATQDQNAAVLVRPFSFYRVTTWGKDKEEKTSKTTQAEHGKAWDVNRVSWIPMGDAGAKFENEQLGLFSLMLLTPLKDAGATVKAQLDGADGTHAIQVMREGAPAAELEFDASGKLVRAGYAGTDPKTGESVTEVYTFSGEIVSNGVKWPKHIAMTRNGSPAYEIDLKTFEALPEKTVRPLMQTLQYEPGGPPSGADAG